MRKAMIVGLMAVAGMKVHAGQEAGETLQGVMRAQWSSEDKAQMKERPLPFSAEDVELIRRGSPLAVL